MKLTRSLIVSVVLVGILIVGSSWGFLVHKTIHQLAVYELPAPLQSFFYTHTSYPPSQDLVNFGQHSKK